MLAFVACGSHRLTGKRVDRSDRYDEGRSGDRSDTRTGCSRPRREENDRVQREIWCVVTVVSRTSRAEALSEGTRVFGLRVKHGRCSFSAARIIEISS